MGASPWPETLEKSVFVTMGEYGGVYLVAYI